MKKFLIINPFGIGDVLFTTPLITALKARFPDSIIGYWCNERVQGIFKNDPNINKIFALSRGDIKRIYNNSKLEGIKKFWSLVTGIRREKFDVSFDFSQDPRYSLLSMVAGIKKRIGFNYKNRGIFLTDKIDIEGYDKKHVIEYYLELLKFIDIKPASKNLYLYVPEGDSARRKNLFRQAGIQDNDLVVGIVPGAGASWGKEAGLKHWPVIRFAQLADRLSRELQAKLVILGDESERSISDAIVKMMKNKPLDLTGKTSLQDFITVIKNLSILVTNDGGPLHIAVALGAKTVSIFGPVDECVYGPYPPSNNHIVIKKDISCRPCYKNFKMPLCDKDRQCIKSIGTEEVFDAVRRLL